MFKRLKNINNVWFFKELPFPLKIFSFFVQGDLIVLLPLIVIIFIIGIFSLQFMFLLLGVYISVRNLGEMIYWFSHRFYERKYRPFDFGFTKLDNNAVYILYQTLAISGVVFGVGIIFFALIYIGIWSR